MVDGPPPYRSPYKTPYKINTHYNIIKLNVLDEEYNNVQVKIQENNDWHMEEIHKLWEEVSSLGIHKIQEEVNPYQNLD